MRRDVASVHLGCLLVAAILAGCAESAFSPHFRDNELTDLVAAVATGAQSATGPRNATGRPLIFVVTRAPTSVVAYDVAAGAVLWSVPADVTSKIVVGREQIYFRSGPRTVEARSLRDGRLVWSAEMLGGDLLTGMAADGDQLYYVTENSKREPGGVSAYLVALGPGGEKRWLRESRGRLGAPMARSGRVYLPFRFQSLAIIDGASGTELARIRSKEETLSWVRDTRAGVLFGGASGVYRLDDKAVNGTQKESTFFAAPLPTTVRPVYWWDGYNPALAGYTAYDRNRLLWQPAPQRVGFLNNTVVVHNYRFFFAFDSGTPSGKQAALRWVFNYPRYDVVASELVGGALVLVTVNGEVVVVDPRVGAKVSQKALKVAVQGASFDVEGYAAPATGAVGSEIRRGLSEVIWDPDRRFGAVKIFCVEQLAQLRGGSVAEDLVKIVTHEGIDPAVYKRAGEMIVSRHDKAAIPLYVRTLQTHSDFVEGTRARAVDVLARALGDLRAKEAVRPLLLHLADHETSLPAATEIVRALGQIGDTSVLEPFRDFLLTYRCDPEFEKVPAALNAASDALLKMGGEGERQLLSFVENDIHTVLPLRSYLGEILRQQKPRAVKKSSLSKKPPGGGDLKGGAAGR